MTAPPRARLAYRPELDGMRAIAVLAVLGFHAAFVVPVLRPYFRAGFLGVDIFFVLSGMLITELLVADHLNHGTGSLGRFYERRARRLLPALGVFMVLSTIYYSLSRNKGLATIHTFEWVAERVTINRGSLAWVEGVSQVWTLVVEWEFYLVWPLVIVLLLKRGISLEKLGYGTAAAAVAITGVRAGLFLHDGGNWLISYFSAWLRFDELLVGCAIGLLGARFQAPGWLRTVALGGLLVVISRGQVQDRFLYLGGMLLIALATASIVQPRTNTWWFDRVLRSPVLVWIGKMSYSLYLWSELVIDEIGHHGTHWSSWTRFVVAIFGSFALATASYYLIERRFRMPSRRGLKEPVPANAT